ncbi:MAG: cadmium-translocating P-type ATPase, partial [Clostridia bacterium]|nr:cadmium-translocating P-type ATPase [Clostridia bacterium]
DVVLSALRGIARGHVFDENFLMSLSSVCAFAIGEAPEAVAVMLFYQIGEFCQDMAVDRSRRSISALMDIRPDAAVVLRNGEWITVPPEEVFVGETILVKPGEKIPLDGVVLEGESMLDTRALTGESVPRIARKDDTVLSGCISQNGVLNVRVTKTYGESTAAKIIDMVENASARKAPTEHFITGFAKYYTPAVVILAVLLAVLPPLLFRYEWADWIRRGCVFLVISCPCALVISIPLTFFGGIGAASRHGILVKGGNYLEALNRVHTVVFDKTGTLTKGVFSVREIVPADGFSADQVLEYAAQAESFSNHPIAKSILSAFGKDVDRSRLTEYTEVSGHGVRVKADGRMILAGNTGLLEERNISFTPCEAPGTKVYVAVDGNYAGYIVIADEIKEDSAEAIAALKRLGVEQTVMLTGDDETIAASVVEELHLDAYHAQLFPDEKVGILEEFERKKRKGSKLIFVGDGINDAPVLARADVGIAMGALGSDAAIEAADVVLMTDEPSKLAEAIGVAKATRRIVVQNIVFALVVKAVFLILGALGSIGMWIAVFGDVGVALIAVLNAMRILKK